MGSNRQKIKKFSHKKRKIRKVKSRYSFHFVHFASLEIN